MAVHILTPEHAIEKASGYVYHNYKRNATEFEEVFGFDPLLLPVYFGVSSHGKIFCKYKFVQDCANHYGIIKANFNTLGVSH